MLCNCSGFATKSTRCAGVFRTLPHFLSCIADNYMNRILFSLFVSIFLGLSACQSSTDKKPVDLTMPENAVPIPVQITRLNCWIERGNFYVTGICNSPSDQWQKIWLRMQPIDSSGQALYIDGKDGVNFPVFSAAIPPRGRSSFFQGWPLTKFSKAPDSCRVICAGAVQQQAGPVLLVEALSGVRMLTPHTPDSDTSATEEKGWQISGDLSNPLTLEAQHPRLELLIYGKDNRLWFSELINPEDRNTLSLIQMDGFGSMASGTKRHFSMQINYGNLPQQLNLQKIGGIEMLAFEHR